MSLNKKNGNPTREDTYVNIISSIVSVAAGQTEGVASVTSEAGSLLNNVNLKRKNKSIKVDIVNDAVNIELSVNTYSQYKIPELVCRLQENIKREVEKATNYRVKAVNVYIVGVIY